MPLPPREGQGEEKRTYQILYWGSPEQRAWEWGGVICASLLLYCLCFSYLAWVTSILFWNIFLGRKISSFAIACWEADRKQQELNVRGCSWKWRQFAHLTFLEHQKGHYWHYSILLPSSWVDQLVWIRNPEWHPQNLSVHSFTPPLTPTVTFWCLDH